MLQSGNDQRTGRDRRRKPTKPLSRYMIDGRRRSIRRTTDQKTHLYVDLYDHYLLLSLVLILLLSVFDAYFTIFHVGRGAQEINPFMNLLIGLGNIYFFIVKYLLTALGLFILCIHKNLLFVKVILLSVFLLYLTVFAYHIALVVYG